MRRINITHLAPSTGVPSLNKDRTDKLYEQTTMGTRESLISFHERFSNALERRKAVGLPDISEDRLASRFISNLDDTRYSDFKITLANWAENNFFAYPTSLAAAYDAAVKWRTSVSSTVASDATVFYADTKKTVSKNNRPHSDRKAKPPTAPTRCTVKLPTKSCSVCGELHWMRDCPIIAEAKKSYTASAHVIYCLEVIDVPCDIISCSRQ